MVDSPSPETPNFVLQIAPGVALQIGPQEALEVAFGNPFVCAGTPCWDYTATQTWPIDGEYVQFATFDFSTDRLLVQAYDGSYVIVNNVPSFNAIAATEANVLFLIANNPTSC